jgi:leucyl-tRNA synthetase
MKDYDPAKIEKKWQKKWEKEKIYEASGGAEKPKFYGLIEFPFPSGDGMHVGHMRSNTAMDIISRKRRMQGFNVLYPIGWDAFGLPTENYAIKTGQHPAVVTKKNSDNFRRQLKSAGFSFDWSREVNTTDPEYYRWTQWIFLQFYKHCLAYKKKMLINWCPKDKIGLANEEVIDGKCERCGTPVEKREKEQWMLAITKYADKLDRDLDTVDYQERIKTQQRNWIGKSEGVNLRFKVKDLNIYFEMYDSIPQTFMAQTFTVIAPEHPDLPKLVQGTSREKEVMEFVSQIKKKKAEGTFDHIKDMEGIFTGRFIEYSPADRELPIWVASYALADYGSGVVNCSYHDERDYAFAKKYNIPLHPVLFPQDPQLREKVEAQEVFYREPNGILEEPIQFKGRRWDEVRKDIIDFIVEKGWGTRSVQYKLRDWVFSRQRYWGEPIPMVHCDACAASKPGSDGWIPVPEDELPVKLPNIEKYQPTDTGESPLAAVPKWVNTKCPECGGPARRETDTMPNWAGSSWYFLRYADPENAKAFASEESLKHWMPVDWYNGGMEHTTLHLLYSRFWNKFLFDIGAVPVSEPYKKRTSHGIILAADGVKMSKSLGNVVNPDGVIETFGADTLRLYEMFMGPFDQMVSWNTDSIVGPRRFLEKVWRCREKTQKGISDPGLDSSLQRTIKKVASDIESMQFNTAVSTMMIFANEMDKAAAIPVDIYEMFLKILAPFAPHVVEELWNMLGHDASIHLESWPKADESKMMSGMATYAVQVNGKLRAEFEAPQDISEEQAKTLALGHDSVKKWLIGMEVKKIVFIKGKLVNIVLAPKP